MSFETETKRTTAATRHALGIEQLDSGGEICHLVDESHYTKISLLGAVSVLQHPISVPPSHCQSSL